MGKNLTVYGIVCPYCDEFVWSRHRHDFRPCGCGYCAIDGGRDYTKVAYGLTDPKKDDARPVPRTEERTINLTEKDNALVNYEPKWPY